MIARIRPLYIALLISSQVCANETSILDDELFSTDNIETLSESEINALLKHKIDKALLRQYVLKNFHQQGPLPEDNDGLVAFLSKQIGLNYQPTQEAIERFFELNPQLFSDRKIYRVQQILVDSKNPLIESIKAQLLHVKNFNELSSWLKINDVEYVPLALEKPAEKWPRDFLLRLYNMEKGEVGFATANDKTIFYQLVDINSSPINLQSASAKIELFMKNRYIHLRMAKLTSELREK